LCRRSTKYPIVSLFVIIYDLMDHSTNTHNLRETEVRRLPGWRASSFSLHRWRGVCVFAFHHCAGMPAAGNRRPRHGTLLLNNITTVLYYGGVRRIREQVDDLIMIGLGLTRLHQMSSTPTTRASRQIAQFSLPLPSCGDKNTARLAGKNRTT